PFLDGWHQFRVLTARYVELILGDPRSLRLLMLQAPLVAVFLLVGFVHKDYGSKIPLPPPLSAHERHVLTVVPGLDRILFSDAAPDPAQKAALDRVHFQVQVAGIPIPLKLDGTQGMQILRQLQKQALDPSRQGALEAAKFTFKLNGEETTVSGAD